MRQRLHISAIAIGALALFSCGRPESPENPASSTECEVRLCVAGFEGAVTVPGECEFDNLRAEIKGFDWEVIEVARSQKVQDVITLQLPETLPIDKLCKVARDNYRDYEGFWPATGVSDRDARVAQLGDIMAYRGKDLVGRLYLTDCAPGQDPTSRHFIYFHYADRPFTLSGYNLVKRPPTSFIYEASFAAGWNPYAKIHSKPGDERYDRLTLVTTDLPPRASLCWRFER